MLDAYGQVVLAGGSRMEGGIKQFDLHYLF